MRSILAATAALLALALPASAAGAPGAIRTVDHPDLGSLYMDASQANPLDNGVTVNPGEKVTFSYPEGTNAHSVAFNSVGPQPTNCVQLTGVAIFAAPPIAGPGLPPAWTGECVFPTPGTYAFYCSVHPNMEGTVVAAAANTAPTVTAARTPSGDVTAGTAINFAAAATDADGDTLTYAWDFGDMTSSTQQNPAKTYSTPGTYAAKVTVSDGRGGTATQTLDVVVTPAAANQAPTVTAARTPAGNTRYVGSRGGSSESARTFCVHATSCQVPNL